MPIKIKTAIHLHKFKRSTYATGSKFYFCINNCNFRVSCELALGKVCECNRCGRPFSMNKYAITLDKPHCEQCHKHKTEETKKRKANKTNKELANNEQVQSEALEAVAELSGDELVSDLRGRLDSALSDSIVRLDSIAEPILEEAKEETKTVEIKEFKLDEEEFL